MTVTITERVGGATLAVRVLPNARKTEIVGTQGDAFKIRLTAPPVEGAANEALLAFVATLAGVRKSAVEIVSGHTRRDKVLFVAGVSAAELGQRLGVGVTP